jgi:hypothetical protein
MEDRMNQIQAFAQNKKLIDKYGENKAYLVWAMALYLDEPDLFSLGNDCLTDD